MCGRRDSGVIRFAIEAIAAGVAGESLAKWAMEKDAEIAEARRVENEGIASVMSEFYASGAVK